MSTEAAMKQQRGREGGGGGVMILPKKYHSTVHFRLEQCQVTAPAYSVSHFDYSKEFLCNMYCHNTAEIAWKTFSGVTLHLICRTQMHVLAKGLKREIRGLPIISP